MTPADKILWRRTCIELGLIVPKEPDTTDTEPTGPSPEQVCESKHRYASKASAQRTADRRTPPSGWRLKTYHCRVCDGYHLTKRPQ